MNLNQQKKIKRKIISTNPQKWWGDNFDVRFYLISKILDYKKKSILEIGGGNGAIIEELPNNNFKINLDLSFESLLECKKKYKNIECINAHSAMLPFKNNYFDVIISGSVLEYNKEEDLRKKNEEKNFSSSIDISIKEIIRILRINGRLFLTTPNNQFYKSNKLFYNELESVMNANFVKFKIYLFNSMPKINRYLDFSKRIPQLKLKFLGFQKTMDSLLIEKNKHMFSKSF